jgi:hypothetical protein
MESTQNTQSENPADANSRPWAELVVRNGRLSGTRRVLLSPITLIGQAANCEVRLTVEGIQPYHCVLVSGPSGLVLRDLQGSSGTLVNGQAVATCPLREGDVLSVGPFQFDVHLPSTAASPEADGLQREKEALRIQAAAVAAQQAALTEAEIQLHQRRVALAQQEQQLAVHLEEKPQRLVTLRDEAREARTTLQQERATYEQRVAEVLRSQVQARREIATGHRQAQDERKRLIELRRRLKRRWHRQWAGERETMRRRETALEQERRRLEKEWERLRQEKASFSATRLRLNGEIELHRRQLEAEKDQFLKQQNEMREQARLLEERKAAVLHTEQHLAREKRYWETHRSRLQKEIEGLEARIGNYRLKIQEQEQAFARREGILRSRENPSVSRVGPSPTIVETAQSPGSVSSPTVIPEEEPGDGLIRTREEDGRPRLAAVEKLAGELADQRLYLAEQGERLAQAQQHWQQERAEVLAELELLGRRLQERERALETGEDRLLQRADDLAHLRRRLEGWSAQLTQREAAWDGDRNRLLADVRTREEYVEKRLAMLEELRKRWDDRRRRQVTWLRTKLAACEERRREWAALRLEWLRRSDVLTQAQRASAEWALALEQYRQECIGQARNPKAAEKRLEKLRRHWAARSAAAAQAQAKKRRDLEAEAKKLEDRFQHLHRDQEDLAAREAEWSSRQGTWEQQQFGAEGAQAKLRQELQSLHQQREHYERQLATVRDEVERLARLLLEESDPMPVLVGQAA